MLNIATFRVNTFLENTYLLFDESGTAVVVDPGMYTQEERYSFDRYVHDLSLRVKYVFLTHAHIDHILGLAYVQQRYGAILVAQEGEIRNLPLLKSYGAGLGYVLNEVNGEMLKVKEGDTIHLGQHLFTILATPGHTPHSISFYLARQHCIFSGDVMYMNSLGNTSLPGGNAAQLKATVQNQMLKLPAETVFYPGHGSVSKIEYINHSILNGYFKGF
jgi:glyoxylase-like metal-dependent hydrolase (beta-lactamase superfamily II)